MSDDVTVVVGTQQNLGRSGEQKLGRRTVVEQTNGRSQPTTKVSRET